MFRGTVGPGTCLFVSGLVGPLFEGDSASAGGTQDGGAVNQIVIHGEY